MIPELADPRDEKFGEAPGFSEKSLAPDLPKLTVDFQPLWVAHMGPFSVKFWSGSHKHPLNGLNTASVTPKTGP